MVTTNMVPGIKQLRYTFVIFIILASALYVLIHFGQIMLGNPRSGSRFQSSLQQERGPIFDRHGRILAIQTEQPLLSAWIPSVRNPENAVELLSRILNLSFEMLSNRLNSSDGYVILQRGLNPAQADAITLLIQQGELRGFTLEEGSRRLYPEGTLAAHVLGFTGIDNRGLEGIELTQNDFLSSNQGVMGNQIFLTIDTAIQSLSDQLAMTAYEEHSAEAVMIMIASARTGEILSWSSVPNFDPNFIGQSTAQSRQNRPIQYIFEPGSVFKIFSVAAIMNAGGIDSQTIFRTAGGYAPPGISPPITDLNNYGNITAEGIIQFSSNVGAALASDTISSQDFHYLLRQFGFGQRTGIPLNGEQLGILRQPQNWTNRSKPTIAIGQEIGVTALQMISAATVFGNSGVLLSPHVIRRVVSPTGEVIFESTRTPLRQVLNPNVTRQMLQYMNTAADFGTGQRARVEGLNISIKTGTAEIIDPSTGRYSTSRFLASSLALLPTEDPELIIYVVIDYPKNEIFGGRIAAPIIRQAAEFLIPYFGIQRQQDETVVQDQQIRIIDPQLPEITTVIPSLLGLSFRSILPLFQDSRFNLEVQGTSGWVVSQVPSPGTPLVPGMDMILVLGEESQNDTE
jgi:cell division protein FtsI (penicillin-binding protein 3)